METDTMIENLRALAGHAGIIDYVQGAENTFVLRWLDDSKELVMEDVYDNFDEDGNPIEPSEDPNEDTYTVASASPGEQSTDLATLLDKWWNVRGRMTFAANNPGHPEDPYGRPDLIYFHAKVKGGITV